MELTGPLDAARRETVVSLDALPFAALVYDVADLCVLNANQAAAELYGYSVEELIALTLTDLAIDPVEVRTAVATRGAERDFHGSYRHRTKSGASIELEAVGQDIVFLERAARLALIRPKAAPAEPKAGADLMHGVLGRARRAVRYLTHYDPLTNLSNRTAFAESLTDALTDARRRGLHVGVVLLDIDDFKRVNDTYGRSGGDRIIRLCADRLRRCVDAGSAVARFGGDSFVLSLPELAAPADAAAIVERVRTALAEPIAVEGLQLKLGASFGIACAPADGESPDRLIGNADMAMYRAKQTARGRYVFFEPNLQRAATQRLRVEHELRAAIEDETLTVAYQPIVDRRTCAVEGVEALVRWPRGRNVTTPPAHFIPLAEETGLIVPLGAFVLREASRVVSDLHARGFPDLRLAVNLSCRQLADEGLPALVSRTLADCGMSPLLLDLEITETFLAADPVRAAALLRELSALGIRIALDDFGTGYSALAFLRQFPVDVLKLDRSFVTDITHNATSRAIAGAVVELARALDLHSLAEGVETEAQLIALRELGCRSFQGFHVARPMSAAALRRYLAAR